MQFTFTVNVEVERTEGKFAGRDEILEQLQEAIESADPGSVDGVGSDGTSNYDVISWDVDEEIIPKVKKGRSRPLTETEEIQYAGEGNTIPEVRVVDEPTVDAEAETVKPKKKKKGKKNKA